MNKRKYTRFARKFVSNRYKSVSVNTRQLPGVYESINYNVMCIYKLHNFSLFSKNKYMGHVLGNSINCKQNRSTNFVGVTSSLLLSTPDIFPASPRFGFLIWSLISGICDFLDGYKTRNTISTAMTLHTWYLLSDQPSFTERNHFIYLSNENYGFKKAVLAIKAYQGWKGDATLLCYLNFDGRSVNPKYL